MKTNSFKTVLNAVINGISGIFLPIVNLISAAGILKGILAILTLTNAVPGASDTYLVLNAMSDSLFYFLPVLLAVTASKKFGANLFTAVVIAGALLYPSLTTALQAGTTVHFFGLPLKGVTYHTSILPMILAAWMLAYTEKFLNKILPDIVKSFLTPLLSILFVGTLTLLVTGPLSAAVGNALAAGYQFIYGVSSVAAGFVLGAVIQLMLIFGFSWFILLLAMNNVALTGHDTVLALIGPAVFAQAGAALAVMLKSKDRAFRATCAAAVVSALFGVTEPALFGVNLPRKKPMIAVCAGGGVGGALVGFSGARAMAFAIPSVVSLPIFWGKGFGLFVVSCALAFGIAFVVALLMKFEA